MGVTGLLTLNNNVYKTSEYVSIIEAADKYRKENPGKKPLILIDGSNFQYAAYEKIATSSLIGGAEIKKATDGVMKFMKRLEENNIDCEIVFDEYLPENRIPIKIKRNNERYMQYKRVFEKLDNNEKLTGQRRITTSGFSYFLQYSLIGKNKRAVVATREADDEIMEIVSKNSPCFAVISDDTDFIICDGFNYLFSMNHCDMDTLTTTYTNRKKMAAKLEIDHNELPYLVTLCGNDIVSRDDLRSFHLSLLGYTYYRNKKYLPHGEIFNAVRKWLKNAIRLCNKRHMAEDLASLMKTPHLALKIEESVRFYNLRPIQEPVESEFLTKSQEWNEILTEGFDRVKRGLFDYEAFRIMTNQILFHGCVTEIYGNCDYLCDVLIARSMYHRLYGLLLADRPSELGPNEVKEMLFTGPNTMNQHHVATPKYPAVKVSLLKLWSADCPEQLKWEMLCWIVDPKLDAKQVQNLPKPLIVPALALHLINSTKRGNDIDWVIEALLTQAALLLKVTLNEINATKSQSETSISIHYSTVYNNLCVSIYNASGACGTPIAIYHHQDVPFFDVRLYNDACQKIKNGFSGKSITDQKYSEVSEAYQQLKEFLYKNKRI